MEQLRGARLCGDSDVSSAGRNSRSTVARPDIDQFCISRNGRRSGGDLGSRVDRWNDNRFGARLKVSDYRHIRGGVHRARLDLFRISRQRGGPSLNIGLGVNGRYYDLVRSSGDLGSASRDLGRFLEYAALQRLGSSLNAGSAGLYIGCGIVELLRETDLLSRSLSRGRACCDICYARVERRSGYFLLGARFDRREPQP